MFNQERTGLLKIMPEESYKTFYKWLEKLKGRVLLTCRKQKYFNPEELDEMANHVLENVEEEIVPPFNAKSKIIYD